MLLVLLALNYADGIITKGLISYKLAEEVNPVHVALLNAGLFLPFKMICASLLIGYLYLRAKNIDIQPKHYIPVKVLTGAYALLVIYLSSIAIFGIFLR